MPKGEPGERSQRAEFLLSRTRHQVCGGEIFSRSLGQKSLHWPLARRTPDTFLEQGDVLYTPQNGMQRLFILKKGRVQVYEVDRSGDEITLSVIEDGSVFGEMALTGQSLQGVYVRALTLCTVVSLKREELEDLIMRKPEVGLGWCAS